MRAAACACLLAALCGCSSDEAAPRAPAPARPAAPAGSAQDTAPREQALREHVAQHPTDVNAKLALANFLYDMDRPHRAAPLYIDVLDQRPDDLSVRTDLGTCYKEMGHFGLARAEYERVLQKHPGHVQATYNLAIVSGLAGDHTRAAELWDRVAVLAPGTPAAKDAAAHAADARRAAAPGSPAGPTTPAAKESAK